MSLDLGIYASSHCGRDISMITEALWLAYVWEN